MNIYAAYSSLREKFEFGWSQEFCFTNHEVCTPCNNYQIVHTQHIHTIPRVDECVAVAVGSDVGAIHWEGIGSPSDLVDC